jgi:hypothetical protein
MLCGHSVRSVRFAGSVCTAALAVAMACSACSNNGQGAGPIVVQTSTGCTVADGGLCSFTPPADPGPGGILFAASGEVLALTGYPFPPVNAGDPVFVDGWAVSFTRLLVTIDDITLSANPDVSPGDQSQTGPTLATVQGPWAVDLAHSDPSYLPGKGGPGEEAAPIAALPPSSAFATDGTRYAFGFQVIAATDATAATADAPARKTLNVNLDADGLADYADMVQEGCSVLYVGTATFNGGTVSGFEDCNSDPEYQNWPRVVNFRLCFKSPSSYINCQNPDNDPAAPFPNEEHERGIAFLSNESVIGQVTIHTDHPFWDSVLHDSPAHFDQFAARVVTVGPTITPDGGAVGGAGDSGTTSGAADAAAVGDGAVPTVTLDLTKGVDYTAYTDALGNPLQWRYCIAPATDVHPEFTGAMAFDPQNVPHCSGGNSATGLCDYYDYTTYNQSTQGHLNSDGLCFVSRHYPSPP